MSRPSLSVIITALNEAGRLPLTLIDVDKHLSEADHPYEIVVVDRGSADATVDISRRLAQLIKNLKIVESKGIGGAEAVKIGMDSGRGEIRVLTDAANSIPVYQFEKALPFLNEGYDMVIGSRKIAGSKPIAAVPLGGRLSEGLQNLFLRCLFLNKIKDPRSGFAVFRGKAAEEIFPRLKMKDEGVLIEALMVSRRLNRKIKEMPVDWLFDGRSVISWPRYFKMILEIFKAFWDIKVGNYNLNDIS